MAGPLLGKWARKQSDWLFGGGLEDWLMGDNNSPTPFDQLMGFNRGAGVGGINNPFAAMREQLPTQLFNQAGVFGQQAQGFLNSRGMFDPNLAEAMRLRAFSGAQSSLAQALAQLSAQEGQYGLQRFQLGENQRQFNIGTDIQLRDFAEQWKSAQPNLLDWLQALAGVAQGAAAFA